jgi:hypothetical protein
MHNTQDQFEDFWADEFKAFQEEHKLAAAADVAEVEGQSRTRGGGKRETKASNKSKSTSKKSTKSKSTTVGKDTSKKTKTDKGTSKTAAAHVPAVGGHWHLGSSADHAVTEKGLFVQQMSLKSHTESVLKVDTVFRLGRKDSDTSVQFHILALAVIQVDRGKHGTSGAYVAFLRERSYSTEEWSVSDDNVKCHEARWLLGVDSDLVAPKFYPASSATIASGQAVWKEAYSAHAGKYGRPR